MNLVIDIGNTRAKAALFETDRLVSRTSWPKVEIADLRAFLTNQKVKRVILSSVRRAVDPEMERELENIGHLVRFSHATPVPVQVAYQTPETLGLDRIAAAAGALARYPDTNSLVIDAGTCMTFEFVLSGGRYLGGNISPGLEIRLRAMAEFTASLPLARVNEVDQWIGYSTDSALRNGAVLGAVMEIEGYIQRCEQEWGNVNAILTGGDALFLANNLKKKIFVHENLVLEGLNKILNHNVRDLE
ncbi:MAG: Type III pantothenate kinase [Haliscomenobacter sp.]|nr:Type III pantothenate kinase [Haliscomenobacter sp.]